MRGSSTPGQGPGRDESASGDAKWWFCSAFAESTMPVVVVAGDLSIVDKNVAFIRESGFLEGEVEGITLTDILNRDGDLPEIERSVCNGSLFLGKVSLHLPIGDQIWRVIAIPVIRGLEDPDQQDHHTLLIFPLPHTDQEDYSACQRDPLTTIAEDSPLPVLVFDDHFKILSANAAFAEMSGVSREDLTSMTARDFSVLGKRGFGLGDALREGRAMSAEVTVEFPSGTVKTLVQYTIPIPDSSGTHRRSFVIYHDATQRRMAAIIDFLPDPTFVIDLEGRVIAWNRAISDLTGVRADEMLGRGDYEYAVPFYGEHRPMLADLVLVPDEEIEAKYSHVVREDHTLVVETYLPGFQGRGAYFWAKASALWDEEGSVTGAIETIREITSMKLVEEEVLVSRKKMAAIIDFLPDPTFAIDSLGKVVSWNFAVAEMTGIQADSILERGDYEYAVPFYGERRPMLADLVLLPEGSFEEEYPQLVRDGISLTSEVFLPTLYGGMGAHLWAKATPLYDAEGNITGAIETVRDITEKKRAEDEVLTSRKKMAEIIDFLPDPTFVIERNGTVISWNIAISDQTGIQSNTTL
ncbi:MAG: PAS domain-containing protein [Methanomicrobiales archaeon]|nr:PAS domain-containing protein [Methanomicrobiales archaeon]